MKLLLFLLVSLLFIPEARAQEVYSLPDLSHFRDAQPFDDPYTRVQAPTIPLPEGTIYRPANPKLTVTMDSSIVRQFEQYRQSHGTVNELPGYRIQIYSGTNDGAQQARFEFMGEYDNIDVYTLYDRPRFKVRVGNYVSQEEAEKFCRQLKLQFPSAFVVPETVQIVR